ncbi:hypothetical protein Ab1vBOLIVR2_gp19 [Agrobacterium phage OLIVR2]|uniref:Uncharacterized protein n=1 Tax=Agrobacterium phage OLIVR1 TaxID=2723769 RepID=A0A858MR04_9CAUD|nr:hypothetical protein KNU98_gp090 [Agrobacterium phage OLIVR1]QIW87214.1 hypothetical protein Ab1vBOLIVR1_gp19 [Agrobacterium phage OLIVR1]QIW87322.1 hypothetical protein Ab1vBOLIVR2_gp19 [Agrobacterium phage OLIVR2]QIW87429.1 hypothetical protein Ab1vBOLIVR3_gp19 [Agrobacterium phage OLIVR3]
MIPQKPVPCAHIADYYEWKIYHLGERNLGNTLLYKGYLHWAAGFIEGYWNNLYRAVITIRRV